MISDLKRDASLQWNDAEYLERAMAHRFCLVVNGDFAGTPKIAETRKWCTLTCLSDTHAQPATRTEG